MRQSSTMSITRSTKNIKEQGLVPGGFDQHKARRAVHFTLVNPLDRHLNTNHNAYKHFQSTLWTWKARRRGTSCSTKRPMAALWVATRSLGSTSKQSSTPGTQLILKRDFRGCSCTHSVKKGRQSQRGGAREGVPLVRRLSTKIPCWRKKTPRTTEVPHKRW